MSLLLDLEIDYLKSRPRRKGDLDRNLTVGYVRESVGDDSQPLAEQLGKMKGCDKVFCDKPVKPGTTSPQPEFQKMYDFLREGDTLVVARLDRLACCLDDLLPAIWDLCRMNVELVVPDQDIDTAKQDCRHFFGALDAIASAMEVWHSEELAQQR